VFFALVDVLPSSHEFHNIFSSPGFPFKKHPITPMSLKHPPDLYGRPNAVAAATQLY
jgi:hypothetical protein